MKIFVIDSLGYVDSCISVKEDINHLCKGEAYSLLQNRNYCLSSEQVEETDFSITTCTTIKTLDGLVLCKSDIKFNSLYDELTEYNYKTLPTILDIGFISGRDYLLKAFPYEFVNKYINFTYCYPQGVFKFNENQLILLNTVVINKNGCNNSFAFDLPNKEYTWIKSSELSYFTPNNIKEEIILKSLKDFFKIGENKYE